MNPDVTILSVGELKGKDDAAASYERYSNKGCHSTVDHGDIIAKCWNDGEVWLRERKRRGAPEPSARGGYELESDRLYSPMRDQFDVLTDYLKMDRLYHESHFFGRKLEIEGII
jgi:hypothetical protein